MYHQDEPHMPKYRDVLISLFLWPADVFTAKLFHSNSLWLDDLFLLFYSEHCANCWLKMKQYSQKNDKKTHPKLIMDLDKWFDNHHTWFIIYSLFTITLMPLYWDSSVLLCRLYLCALTPFFKKLFWGTLWKENPSNKSCFGGFRDKML